MNEESSVKGFVPDKVTPAHIVVTCWKMTERTDSICIHKHTLVIVPVQSCAVWNHRKVAPLEKLLENLLHTDP